MVQFLWHLLTAVLVGFAVCQIQAQATTILLHRACTHRALVLHPLVQWIFKLVNWLGTGQVVKEWVAVHRKHHAFADTKDDPHSPEYLGFWTVQLTNAWLYIKEKRNPDTIRDHAKDFLNDGWWDTLLFNHGWLGLVFGITLLCSVLGITWGLVASFVHAISYVGILTACVNAIGHYPVRGAYQNYTTPIAEKTYNYKWLAVLTGGEGCHNNHHGDQRSAKLSHRDDEWDPAWFTIRALEKLGLATNVQRPKSVPAAS